MILKLNLNINLPVIKEMHLIIEEMIIKEETPIIIHLNQ